MIGRKIAIWRNALGGGLFLAALLVAMSAAAQGYVCPPGFTLVPAYYAPGYACVPDDYLYPPPDYVYPPFVAPIIVFDRFHRFDRFSRFHGHDFRFNHFGAPGHSRH
jgi:hypothetical protein